MARSRSSQRGASPTSQQVRVGIFTLLALVAAFVVWLYISDIGARARGYPIAVHFKDVGALQEGASVVISGVAVGDVTKIDLLPDQTVLAEAVISKGTTVYRESTFTVESTLTGQSSLAIKPPHDLAHATVLAHGIPADPNDAPWGVLPPTITDLVSESQAQLKSLEKTVAIINVEMPRLARRFDSVASHTDHLITRADTNFTELSESLKVTVANLNRVVALSGNNIISLTGNLNGLVANNSERVQQLVDALSDTAKNLNTTMANFAALTGDPTIRQSLVQTAVNFKDASEKLKVAATELQSLTGDPNVQAQLRGTISNLNDVTAKANDLLGNFSTATGPLPTPAAPLPEVTPLQGATPAPGAVPLATPFGGVPPAAAPAPHASPHQNVLANLKLVEPDVRLYWDSRFNGGPTSDLNFTFLPRAPGNFTLGANSLGHDTTYNVLLNRRVAPGFTLSAGVLYSNLGVKAVYLPSFLGIDARLYNSNNPTLDLYGDVKLAKQIMLFYGEKNVFGPNTLTPTFGMQANF
ncbi:MAG: MCE family protein [Candidatus Eremiobacteraeota bacterium]|nr:MCE family protein [Candidatus Eremiobacteraeota bacterium]